LRNVWLNGPPFPGATWINCKAISCAAGSTQKYVPQAPVQVKLPTDPGTQLHAASLRMAKPSPQVEPPSGPTTPLLKPAKRMSGGSEFVVISCTVAGERMRTPSSSPPLSSIWQNRR
jgi:hypothetical protein